MALLNTHGLYIREENACVICSLSCPSKIPEEKCLKQRLLKGQYKVMGNVYKNCSNVTNSTVLKVEWLLQKRHPHHINKRALKSLLNQQLSNKRGCNVWLMNFVMNINKHCSLLRKLTPGSRIVSISWWRLYFYFTFIVLSRSSLTVCFYFKN